MITSEKSNVLNELKKAFHSIQKRFTIQRQRIWEAFSEQSEGCTIAQAAERLRATGIGQATVYRTVKDLVDLGFLKWVHDPDGEHRYVACGNTHCHPVVCRVCGNVKLFSCEGLNTLQKLISIETGFFVEGHHLEIFGICSACRSA
jgi:Fur family transcriptional regulator, ferric uptake regulator